MKIGVVSHEFPWILSPVVFVYTVSRNTNRGNFSKFFQLKKMGGNRSPHPPCRTTTGRSTCDTNENSGNQFVHVDKYSVGRRISGGGGIKKRRSLLRKHTNAVIQPLAMVVEPNDTFIAVPAVLAGLVNKCPAQIARRWRMLSLRCDAKNLHPGGSLSWISTSLSVFTL